MKDKTIHQGKNIRRFREILGVKEDALAISLGDETDEKIAILEKFAAGERKKK